MLHIKKRYVSDVFVHIKTLYSFVIHHFIKENNIFIHMLFQFLSKIYTSKYNLYTKTISIF